MARAISVKVSTAKVIKALEAKLSDSQKAVASNEKKRKDYEKVEKAWAKQVGEIIIKNISRRIMWPCLQMVPCGVRQSKVSFQRLF